MFVCMYVYDTHFVVLYLMNWCTQCHQTWYSIRPQHKLVLFGLECISPIKRRRFWCIYTFRNILNTINYFWKNFVSVCVFLCHSFFFCETARTFIKLDIQSERDINWFWLCLSMYLSKYDTAVLCFFTISVVPIYRHL